MNELKLICQQYNVKLPHKLSYEEAVYFVQCLYYAVNNHLSLSVGDKCLGKLFDYQPVFPPSNWLDHLTEHGWTIVKIDDFDHARIVSCFFSWLESTQSGFDRHNPQTWTKDRLPSNSHGIFRHYIGHEPFMWETREKTLDIFKQLWQTDDLLSSFDGGSFLLPDEQYKAWVHCDQDRYVNGFANFQGIVNLVDNGPTDGGLLLLSNSHRIRQQYLEKYPLVGHKGQFMIDLNDELIQQCQRIKVCAPAGHLILFDSQIFHCNVPPKKSVRMSIYVSMQPRINDQTILNQRVKAFENNQMTGHWCYGHGFSINPKKPNTYGRKEWIPQSIPFIPNEQQKRLIGY